MKHSSVMYEHSDDMGFVNVMCRLRLRCVTIQMKWACIRAS